jgi:hypothetical protein
MKTDKALADEIRKSAVKLNNALQAAKDANLEVRGYHIGRPESQFDQYTELYVAEIYRKVVPE